MSPAGEFCWLMKMALPQFPTNPRSSGRTCVLNPTSMLGASELTRLTAKLSALRREKSPATGAATAFHNWLPFADGAYGATPTKVPPFGAVAPTGAEPFTVSTSGVEDSDEVPGPVGIAEPSDRMPLTM